MFALGLVSKTEMYKNKKKNKNENENSGKDKKNKKKKEKAMKIKKLLEGKECNAIDPREFGIPLPENVKRDVKVCSVDQSTMCVSRIIK